MIQISETSNTNDKSAIIHYNEYETTQRNEMEVLTMAIDYGHTAKELIAALGGSDNINNVTHCATRLRFILKNRSLVNQEKANKVKGVITTVEAGGQFQVVIGNHVKDAYEEVLKLVDISEDKVSTSTEKVGVVSRIIDIISSIFAPFLYTLAACGILQGILGVLVALDWINTEGGTYQVLNFISWTAFTFLPVLIAITAARKFKINEFIAVVIACALISPDYNAMVSDGTQLSFLGIQIQMLSYTSSVIPVILAVWVASYVARFFEKVLPTVIRNLFTPMFTIAIMVPFTLLVFGPFGATIGGAIGDTYNYLYNLSPIVAGIIVGGFWQVLVIFGVHWGITPVTVGNYASLGYDTFTALQASAVFSQAGAAFGVYFKTKNKELKDVSLPAAITAVFGITEPVVYGVNLRLKKPMIAGCIAGAIGGAIAGGFNAVSWSYNMPGIATIPAFFKAGFMTPFLGFLISIVVSFVLGMILTMIIGFEDEVETEEIKTSAVETVTGSVMVGSPAKGSVVTISEVNDEVFASEAMGKGVGIKCVDGVVVAPCDAKIVTVFPTKHAIGLETTDGVELLIHIGINTVNLKGQGFEAKVKEGQYVKAGDVLVEFDIETIKEAGYDDTIMVVITNTPQFNTININANADKARCENIFEIIL